MGYYRDTLGIPATATELDGVATARTHPAVGRGTRGWDEALAGRSRKAPGISGACAFREMPIPSGWRRRRRRSAAFARAIGWIVQLQRALDACLPRSVRYLTDRLEEAARSALRAGAALCSRLCKRLATALEAVLRATWSMMRRLVDRRTRARRLWTVMAFAGTNLIGLLREGALLPGFEFMRLDEQDYKAWLRGHAESVRCPARFTWDSPPVNAMLTGVQSTTTFSAGTMIRNALDLALNYRGHVTYKLQGGMGDVVFAPLYLVLARRGVQFRFFHRVVDLRPAAGMVAAIEVEEQIDAPATYDPLISVQDVPCWPSEPNAEQLPARYREELTADGPSFDFEGVGGSPYARRRITLRAGRDFDVAVLGIPVGALPPICGQLMAVNRRSPP
jgi:uncharacterized protein with NAD-binding domain and iron-sulfur cluster